VYSPPEIVSNTLPALELTEQARAEGRLDGLHRRLYEAYWAEGRDIGDVEVLLGIAEETGIDGAVAAAALEDRRFTDVVEASTAAAIRLGVTGVPAWVVDGRLLVPGAQPHEVFERALARLGYEPLGGEPPLQA
jgi:predicted DsbA family dithiol-disulfide isomerase